MALPTAHSETLAEPLEGVSRTEMAKAGLQALSAIAGEWGLNTEQQRRLLGNPGRSRFFDLKGGRQSRLSDDELDRLAYLTGIYAALNILYDADNTLLWLRNPSEPDSIWRGQSPLDYMLSGKLVALADVYRYLNGLRGAA